MRRHTRQYVNQLKRSRTPRKRVRLKRGRTVMVLHDDVLKAIRQLRRRMVDNKLFLLYKLHQFYTKLSVKRRKRLNLKRFKTKLWSNL